MIVFRFVIFVISLVVLMIAAAAYPVSNNYGEPGLAALYAGGTIAAIGAILGLAPILLVPYVSNESKMMLPLAGVPVRILSTIGIYFAALTYAAEGMDTSLLGVIVISLYILLLGLETWFIIRLNNLFLAVVNSQGLGL